eukprot:m.8010 g.8010  ORF g.8010 m.8010 type:complete len:56 (+) comp6022_c0_seq1:104-271(+)
MEASNTTKSPVSKPSQIRVEHQHSIPADDRREPLLSRDVATWEAQPFARQTHHVP